MAPLAVAVAVSAAIGWSFLFGYEPALRAHDRKRVDGLPSRIW